MTVIKIWQVTKAYLIRLTGYRQLENKKPQTYSETLANELKVVHDVFEDGTGRLEIATTPKNRNQTSVKIPKETYDHLCRIRAYVMLVQGEQHSLQKIMHSVVKQALSEYE